MEHDSFGLVAPLLNERPRKRFCCDETARDPRVRIRIFRKVEERDFADAPVTVLPLGRHGQQFARTLTLNRTCLIVRNGQVAPIRLESGTG
jgi:hypothetical protein